MSLRIAHLVERPNDIGGVPTYLSGLLPALRGREIDNVVVTADGGLSEFAGAPCVHVSAIRSDSSRVRGGRRRELLDALRSTDADLAFAHQPGNPDVVIAASEVVPVVLYAHDYYPVCPGTMRYLHRSVRLCSEGPGLRCFWRAHTERCTNRRPDRQVRADVRTRAWRGAWPHLTRVLVASPFVAELLAHDGVPNDLLRVVPVFVEQKRLAPMPPEHDVVFLGRLVAAKGVHVLLRALAQLDGVTAVVGGDGPARPALERLVAALGLSERVRFLGWADAARRSRLFAAGRVAVVPSLWDEPFGMVGVEALGAGLPVVGTAVGGIPSWLPDGQGGILVPRGDSTALAAALERLLSDEEYRLEQAELAPRAATRFSLERHLELLLPELVDASRAR